MLRFGGRVAWKEKEGFGTYAYKVSLEEFNESEIESRISSCDKPDASFVHFFCNEESIKHLYEKFVPRDDDIYICTYAKSGTTWMQQIVYQLVYGPTEDFEDITLVSPWLETSIGHGVIMNNEKYPRIIKTHLRFEHLPNAVTNERKGKFLFIERDICDVFGSYKRHLVGFGLNIQEKPLLDIFVNHQLSLGPYGEYINNWKEKGKPILGDHLMQLTFEDMKKDSKVMIKSVAEFLKIEVSEERMEKVLELCTIEYMKAHIQKFNHNPERELSISLRSKNEDTRANLKVSGEDFSFIGKGAVGTYTASLSAETQETLKKYAKRYGIE